MSTFVNIPSLVAPHAGARIALEVYRTELEVTSRINRHLSAAAFRNIALGANDFRLLALEYEAPSVGSN